MAPNFVCDMVLGGRLSGLGCPKKRIEPNRNGIPVKLPVNQALVTVHLLPCCPGAHNTTNSVAAHSDFSPPPMQDAVPHIARQLPAWPNGRPACRPQLLLGELRAGAASLPLAQGVVWLCVTRLMLRRRLARLLTSSRLLHACPCQVRLVRGCIAVWPFR